jgi:hypothetical protein
MLYLVKVAFQKNPEKNSLQNFPHKKKAFLTNEESKSLTKKNNDCQYGKRESFLSFSPQTTRDPQI